jgi:hypothetical protein
VRGNVHDLALADAGAFPSLPRVSIAPPVYRDGFRDADRPVFVALVVSLIQRHASEPPARDAVTLFLLVYPGVYLIRREEAPIKRVRAKLLDAEYYPVLLPRESRRLDSPKA